MSHRKKKISPIDRLTLKSIVKLSSLRKIKIYFSEHSSPYFSPFLHFFFKFLFSVCSLMFMFVGEQNVVPWTSRNFQLTVKSVLSQMVSSMLGSQNAILVHALASIMYFGLN